MGDNELIARLRRACELDPVLASDGEWTVLLCEAMNARDRLEALVAKVAELEGVIESYQERELWR